MNCFACGAAASPSEAERADTSSVPFISTPQAISGTYRGVSATQEVELRIDLDGPRSMNQLSGDVFEINGSKRSYVHSFRVLTPTRQETANVLTAGGNGTFSIPITEPYVNVTIPRVGLGSPLAPATVTFARTAGTLGTTFSCAFVTRAFRVVEWEHDSVADLTPFDSLEVGPPLSAGPRRTLTVSAAYAEMGIELRAAGETNVVPNEADAVWSDAELHASMINHFKLYAEERQWRVWLLVATEHTNPLNRGIMFDHQGLHRQGCAVFVNSIGGTAGQKKRMSLRTYVHELGHCFNLVHSWEKTPKRLNALSYMNSPEGYPGGSAAYWAAFPFQFDDLEIAHLRHGFRNNVIMGGTPLGSGAADSDALMFEPAPVENPDLDLRIESPSRTRGERGVAHRYRLGEPVVVELRLSSFDIRGKEVHAMLHPNYGYVRIVVRQPGGALRWFRPLATRCLDPQLVLLQPDAPMYTSAYIGYGKDGFTFAQPGVYGIRAVYQAPDGYDIVSNVLHVRVGSPRSHADEEIADLYFGDDQGKLFTFIGSDDPSLSGGNDALETVIQRWPAHPLSAYASLAKGMVAKRPFQYVTSEKTIYHRDARPEAAAPLLEGATAPAILDNVTANKAMRELAKTYADLGDYKTARGTLKAMVRYFERQRLRPSVLETIRAQAAETAREFRP